LQFVAKNCIVPVNYSAGFQLFLIAISALSVVILLKAYTDYRNAIGE